MSKLIMVGVLVGVLLTGAVPSMAQQGGIGDPLTLATSGVVIPYFSVGGAAGAVSLLEVASPVADNPDMHMNFFSATCVRTEPSVGMPLTTNDIAFQPINPPLQPFPAVPTSGLIAIGSTGPDGFTTFPLQNPIHARVYVFDPADGSSRVLEPIIIDSAEFPGNPHTWSPLRTAVTFFSPLVTATVRTHLFLVCPTNTIQSLTDGYFSPANGFPVILPPFPAGAHSLRARVYEATTEVFKRNVFTTCTCFTQKNLENPADLDSIYINAVEVALGTYTEMEEDPTATGHSAFTGYRSIFTVGSPLNNFFGRLSNGNLTSIQGTLTDGR
jgi:hypothetical protein